MTKQIKRRVSYNLYMFALRICTLYFGIVIVLFFVFQFAASAQTIPGLNPSADLMIKASPEVPAAGQQVTLNVTSLYLDVNRSIIGWYVNDKLLQEGAALKQITIQAGAAGTRTKIGVVAFEGDRRAVQYMYISPASVDILWQAKTYVPPLYEGKAPYTNQADVLFYAIPDFPGYAPSDIVFEWSRNNSVVDKGRGMETIVIPSRSIAERQIINVTAETADQKFRATKSIALNPLFPEILVYEENPLTGFNFAREASRGGTYPTEFTLASFPFGFSTTNRFSNTTKMYWLVNNKAISDNNTQSAVFRKEGGGLARIVIRASITGKPLQIASKRYDIQLDD